MVSRATPSEYFNIQTDSSGTDRLVILTLGLVAIVGLVVAAIVLGRK